jgi:hypothetical protein
MTDEKNCDSSEDSSSEESEKYSLKKSMYK